jgi:2-polyprenyl-3-methyl-5-hydroxy-6-metoxy-1,4-benzoquinol methylase
MELPDKTLAMSPEIDFRAWNEDMARKYSPGRYHEESHFLIRWVERQRVKTIIRLLQPRAGDMVLEVGCGSGNVLEALPHGTKPVGIDLSSMLVTESRVRLAGRGGMIAQANAEQLPFPTGHFSRIICTEVLEHVQRPEVVLGEIARVAKPDAIIVISIPNERLIDSLRQWTSGIRALWRTGGADEWHLHEFDMAYLYQKAAGHLAIREVVPIIANWMPLRYVVRCACLPVASHTCA